MSIFLGSSRKLLSLLYKPTESLIKYGCQRIYWVSIKKIRCITNMLSMKSPSIIFYLLIYQQNGSSYIFIIDNNNILSMILLVIY